MLDKFKSMQNLDSEGMIKIMQSLDSVALGIISSMQSLLNVQWRNLSKGLMDHETILNRG